jgi:hypothetical protein
MRREHRARTVVFDESDPRALLVARVLARLDAFELLGFEGGRGPIVVRDRRGRSLTGRHALAEAVAALPLGPIFAWILALPTGEVARALLGPSCRAIAALPPRRELGFARPLALSREVLAACLVAVAASSYASYTPSLKNKYKQPLVARIVSTRLNMREAWRLFTKHFYSTPFLVVDATTADGRHVDPFTGKPPRTGFGQPLSSEGYPEHWIDYLNRVEQFPEYRAGLLHYIEHYADRTGRPEDRVVSFTVSHMVQPSPPFGSKDYGPVQLVEVARSQGPSQPAEEPPKQ